MAKVVVKAVPGMILGGIIPGLCFLVGRREWGLAGGVVLVLLWSGDTRQTGGFEPGRYRAWSFSISWCSSPEGL